ncbi:MAG: hypothetical protein ABIR70_20050 [Bryobacteraceae bacterium]
MSEIQNILLASLPIVITVLVGILMNNARLTDLRSHMDSRFSEVDRRFNETDRRIDNMHSEMNRRFDDSKDVWKSELHRVEEILDARLKHLESR